MLTGHISLSEHINLDQWLRVLTLLVSTTPTMLQR